MSEIFPTTFEQRAGQGEQVQGQDDHRLFRKYRTTPNHDILGQIGRSIVGSIPLSQGIEPVDDENDTYNLVAFQDLQTGAWSLEHRDNQQTATRSNELLHDGMRYEQLRDILMHPNNRDFFTMFKFCKRKNTLSMRELIEAYQLLGNNTEAACPRMEENDVQKRRRTWKVCGGGADFAEDTNNCPELERTLGVSRGYNNENQVTAANARGNSIRWSSQHPTANMYHTRKGRRAASKHVTHGGGRREMSRQLTVDKRAYQKRAHILKGRTKSPDLGGSRGGLAMEGRYLSKNNFQRLVAGAVQKIQQGQQAHLNDPYVLFPRAHASRVSTPAGNERIGRWRVSYANHQHNLHRGDQVVVLLRSQTGGEGTCNEQGLPWRENSQGGGPWWTPEYRVVLDTGLGGATSWFSIYDVPWVQTNNLRGGMRQISSRRPVGRRRPTAAEGSNSRASATTDEQTANVEANVKIIISFEQAVKPLAMPRTFNVSIRDGATTQVKRLTNRNKYGNEVKHWIGSGNTNGTYGLPALCGGAKIYRKASTRTSNTVRNTQKGRQCDKLDRLLDGALDFQATNTERKEITIAITDDNRNSWRRVAPGMLVLIPGRTGNAGVLLKITAVRKRRNGNGILTVNNDVDNVQQITVLPDVRVLEERHLRDCGGNDNNTLYKKSDFGPITDGFRKIQKPTLQEALNVLAMPAVTGGNLHNQIEELRLGNLVFPNQQYAGLHVNFEEYLLNHLRGAKEIATTNGRKQVFGSDLMEYVFRHHRNTFRKRLTLAGGRV
jgi:hypothetical protein